MKVDVDELLGQYEPSMKVDIDELMNPPGANDDDSILKAGYCGFLSNTGNAIHTINDANVRANKPDYMSDDEWQASQTWLTKGISEFGRNLENEYKRDYKPWSANRIAAGVAGAGPYMIALGAEAAALAKSRNYRALGQLANQTVQDIGALGKLAPQAAKVAEKVVPALTVAPILKAPEAAMEWQSAYDGYIEKAKRNGTYVQGETEKKADEFSKGVFRDNMLLLSGTGLIDTLALTTKLPTSAVRNALLKMGITGGINAGEEMAQQIFPKAEAGEEYHVTDDDVLESGLVGFIVGGGMGGASATVDYLGNRVERSPAPAAGGDNVNGWISDAAQETGLDERLLRAVIQQESSFNPQAGSSAGAYGYMQLMPDTAEALGVDRTDPRQNILGGARYLKQQLDAFGGDLEKALAAYNAGPQAVKDAGGVPNFAETKNYVKNILANYKNGTGLNQHGIPRDHQPADVSNADASGLPISNEIIDFVNDTRAATRDVEERNFFDGMFDNNDRFIDTPKTRQKIKERYGNDVDQYVSIRKQAEAELDATLKRGEQEKAQALQAAIYARDLPAMKKLSGYKRQAPAAPKIKTAPAPAVDRAQAMQGDMQGVSTPQAQRLPEINRYGYMKTIAKQGYIELSTPKIIQAFRNDPMSKGFTESRVGEKTRFTAPQDFSSRPEVQQALAAKVAPVAGVAPQVDLNRSSLNQLAVRQGYVDFSNPQYAAAFRNDPMSKGFTESRVGEKTRFTAPRGYSERIDRIPTTQRTRQYIPPAPQEGLPQGSISTLDSVVPNLAGVQAVDALKAQRQQPTSRPGFMQSAEQRVENNALRAAVNRGDYVEAARIAAQSGNKKLADMLSGVTRQGARERIGAEDLNVILAERQFRQSLTEEEGLFIDFVEDEFANTGNAVGDILSGLKNEREQEIAAYIEGLRGQMGQGVERRTMTPTESADSGYSFAPGYSKNYKWYQDMMTVTNGKKMNKADLEQHLRETAVEHLSRGYTDPLYGRQVSEESVDHFNVREDAIHGIESIQSKANRYRQIRSGVSGKNQGRDGKSKTNLRPDALEQAKIYGKLLINTAKEKGVKADYAKLERHIDHGAPRATAYLERELAKRNVDAEKIKFSLQNAPAELADGYRTQSGRSLQEAGEREFIVKPDGSIDFGEITPKIEKESNGRIKAGKIRLQVGNKDYGLIHSKKHENEARNFNYSSVEDFISDIAKNFDQIYESSKVRGNYILVRLGDKQQNKINGFSPVYFELNSDGDSYYVVISAIPKGDKNLKRSIKKESLIYSRPGLDSATTSNSSAVSKLDGENVGAANLVPTSVKSNDSITHSIPQGGKNTQDRLKGNLKHSEEQTASDQDFIAAIGEITRTKIWHVPEEKYSDQQRHVANVAKQMGCRVAYYDGHPRLHGFHTDDVSYLNQNSSRTQSQTFWHESFHWMRNNNDGLYKELVAEIQKHDPFTKEQIADYRKTIARGELRGDDGGYVMTDDDIIEEMLADKMADVAGRLGLSKLLARENATLYERFVAWVNDMIQSIKNFASNPISARQAKAMEQAFYRMARDMRDGVGRWIFRLRPDGRLELARTGEEVGANTGRAESAAVAYSADKRSQSVVSRGEIRKFIENALKDNAYSRLRLNIGMVTEQEAMRIKNAVGIDVHGYTHVLGGNDVRHIHNRHGQGNEINVGQHGLNAADIADAIDAVKSPEAIEKGSPTKSGASSIRFIKSDASGKYTVVEVVRDKNKQLAIKTIWKKITAKRHASNAGPQYTSKTDSGLSSSDINYSIPQTEKDAQGGKNPVKFSADNPNDMYTWSIQRLHDRIFGPAPAKGVTVRPADTSQKMNPLRNTFNSVHKIAEKYPIIKPFFRAANIAREKTENLRAHFNHRLVKIEKELGNHGMFKKTAGYKKNKEDLIELLWRGDSERVEYTTGQLQEMGYNANVIKAYKMMRAAIKHAYNLVNDVKQSVKTYTKTLPPGEVEKLRSNKFTTIISDIPVNDVHSNERVVTYKQPRLFERRETLTRKELDALKTDENVQVISVKPDKSTVHIMPGAQGLLRGDEFFVVEYRSQASPLGKIEGYIPHLFHNWFVMRKVKNEDGSISYNMLKSAKTLEGAVAMANEFVKQSSGSEVVVSPKQFQFPDEALQASVIGDKEYHRMMEKLAEDLSISLDDAKNFMADKIHMRNRRRFLGSMQHREGKEGYERDIDWVLRHHFNQVSRYVAMDEFKRSAISDFEKFFNKWDSANHQGIARYVRDYINDQNGIPGGAEKSMNDLIAMMPWLGKKMGKVFGDRPSLQAAGWLTGIAAAAKLNSLNFASTMIQFSQIMNIAGALNSYTYMYKGMQMAKNPSLAQKIILHKAGLEAEIGMHISGGYSNAEIAGRLLGATTYTFAKADRALRATALLGAYKQGIDKGMSRHEAIQYAKEINREANFDYGVTDAPNIFRRGGPISQVILQFQKYPIKQMEFMWDMITQGQKVDTGSVTSFAKSLFRVLRTNDKGQMARFFVPYLLLSGIVGIPFVNLFGGLLAGLFGYDDWEEKVKKEAFAWAGEDEDCKAWVKLGLYGIAAVPEHGADISYRVGIGDFATMKLPKTIAEAASMLFGVAGSSVYQAWRQEQQGNTIEALKAISPGIGNILTAFWAGEVKTKRGRIKTVYDDMYEKILKGAGFMPINEKIESDKNYIVKSEEARRRKEEQEAIDAYLSIEKNGSDAEKLEAVKKLRALKISGQRVHEERARKRRGLLERLGGKEQARYKEILNF